MSIVPSPPYNLVNGTTADATQVMADFNSIITNVNANAAHNGANTDITSLSGLTTPLTIPQGGTGANTASGARANIFASWQLFYSSNYATLALADAAAVAGNGVLVIDANWSLTGDTTIASANVEFQGGVITRGAHNLVFSGYVTAAAVSIFDKSGSGSVTFSNNQDAHLRWFAPTADGTTDDTVPCRAWVASSANRIADAGQYRTDTMTIPAISTVYGGTHRLSGKIVGVSTWTTQFISLSGNDIFLFSTNALDAVFNFNIGNFTGTGPGVGVGSGYVVHSGSGGLADTNLIFEDIYQDAMGGGCILDEMNISGASSFSAVYRNLMSATCGKHHFDIYGGPAVLMENCYPQTITDGYCGYRIHTNAVLLSCNGINAGKIWGIFGNDTSTTVIDSNLTGHFTVPADATLNYSTVTMIGCNVEAFTCIGVLVKQGIVNLKGNTSFLNAATANVAVYTAGGINYGGTSENTTFILSGNPYAKSSPVWQYGVTCPFAFIAGNFANQSLNCYDFFNSRTYVTSTAYQKWIGTIGGTDYVAQTFNTLEVDTIFQTGASSKLGFYGSTPLTKQAVTGALSTVSDAAAKAVLTSILAALTNYNLVTNSTT